MLFFAQLSVYGLASLWQLYSECPSKPCVTWVKYLSSRSSRAQRQAARAVGELVFLQVHQGISLPLNVRFMDVVQGLQTFCSHRTVPTVQRGCLEPPVVVRVTARPSAPSWGQGVVIPRELGISSWDHGSLSLLTAWNVKTNWRWDTADIITHLNIKLWIVGF